jgi:hypothetical protein
MKPSSLSFQAAVLLVIVGMVWGIVMAISQDHSAMPAHAHLERIPIILKHSQHGGKNLSTHRG